MTPAPEGAPAPAPGSGSDSTRQTTTAASAGPNATNPNATNTSAGPTNATVAVPPTVADVGAAQALLRRALAPVTTERTSVVVSIVNGSLELAGGRIASDPVADATLVETRAGLPGMPFAGALVLYAHERSQVIVLNGTAYAALRGGSHAASDQEDVMSTFLPNASVPDLRNATVKSFSLAVHSPGPAVEATVELTQLGLRIEATVVVLVSPPRLLRIEAPYVATTEIVPPPCDGDDEDLPPGSDAWTDEQWDEWYAGQEEEDGYAEPPPESAEWTDEQWDAWYLEQDGAYDDPIADLPPGWEQWTEEQWDSWYEAQSAQPPADDEPGCASDPIEVTSIAGRVTAEFAYGADVELVAPPVATRGAALAFRKGDFYTGPGPLRILTFVSSGGVAVADVEAHVKRPAAEPEARGLPDPANLTTEAVFRLRDGSMTHGDVRISFEDRDADGNVSRGDRLVLARETPGAFPPIYLFDTATQAYVVPGAGIVLAALALAGAAAWLRRRA